MTQIIKITDIMHHPMNPRNDYGDLSELAASIKAVGILQPLTVVANENEPGMYWVVIGNRRLEAAISAGLTHVPCQIESLSHEEIMNAMLAENMLRENLTAYEEAEGFQTMLDLGKTIEQVADTYGYSKATVSRRTNLLKLDKTEFKKATERGATLFDMAKVEDIEDEDVRKKVLAKAGTKDFANELQRAKEKQENKAFIEAKEQEVIHNNAIRVDHTSYKEGIFVAYENPKVDDQETGEAIPIKQVGRYSTYYKEDKVVEMPESEIYYYTKSDHDICIYKRIDPDYVAPKTPEEILREKKEEEKKIRNKLREEIEERFVELRREFLLSYKPKKADYDAIFELLGRAIASTNSIVRNTETTEDLVFEGENYDRRVVYKAEDQLKYNILMAYYKTGCGFMVTEQVWDSDLGVYTVKFNSDRSYKVYDFLCKVGYEPSDEEAKLLDGSHEIYDNSWAEKYRKTENK